MCKLLSVILSAICLLISESGILGASPGSKCGPGGQYFDKHVGQWGRWQCCDALCKTLLYRDLCRKRCPNYQESSIKETSDTSAPSSGAVVPVVLALVVVFVFVVIAVLVLMKKRGWLGELAPVWPFGTWHRERPQGRGGGEAENHPPNVHVPDIQPEDAQNPGIRQSLLDNPGQPENLAGEDDVVTGPGRGSDQNEGSSGRPGPRLQPGGGLAASRDHGQSNWQDSAENFQTSRPARTPIPVEDSSTDNAIIH